MPHVDQVGLELMEIYLLLSVSPVRDLKAYTIMHKQNFEYFYVSRNIYV